jgi:DNA-directed RNA polymerase subunit RPC12/RpoP
MVTAEPMSEFKFACPVCGQHITADSSTSGGQIECPTCFQKIVVPQAPASAETKFILSASQVSKPRPVSANGTSLSESAPRSRARLSVGVLAASLLIVCAAGAGIYLFRERIMGAIGMGPHGAWSLDLKNATFPETNAVGRLHGRAFTCEHATVDGPALTLREGRTGPPALGVTIIIPRRFGREFAGRIFEIAPGQPPPLPRVVLRWKDEHQEPAKQDFTNGYALKLAFDQPAEGRLPGKIYLCLPDDNKSVVAGRFEAILRKPREGPRKGPRPKAEPPHPQS